MALSADTLVQTARERLVRVRDHRSHGGLPDGISLPPGSGDRADVRTLGEHPEFSGLASAAVLARVAVHDGEVDTRQAAIEVLADQHTRIAAVLGLALTHGWHEDDHRLGFQALAETDYSGFLERARSYPTENRAHEWIVGETLEIMADVDLAAVRVHVTALANDPRDFVRETARRILARSVNPPFHGMDLNQRPLERMGEEISCFIDVLDRSDPVRRAAAVLSASRSPSFDRDVLAALLLVASADGEDVRVRALALGALNDGVVQDAALEDLATKLYEKAGLR